MKSTEFIRENDQSDSDLFGNNHLASTLADKFEFPEEGALGYKIGGGGISYGGGHRTEGLVIVDRESNQIAFIPDFTYFDDEPTQEDLDFLFYDEDGVEKLPLSMQNIKKFLSLKEDDSDDDLFADRKSTQLATFFTERAREWYRMADEQRADPDNEEYADGTESDAYAFEEVAEAFKLGMDSGLDAFRGLDTDPRETVAEEIEEVLDIDLYALAYHDINESDDEDMFSDRKRIPPKNLHALLQWAGNDPEKRYFRWVANFGIKHNLNLAATLRTLSDFDAIDDDDLESTWGITDEREAIGLFNAYEHVYDAWIPNDFDHDNSSEETWVDEGAEAELEEPPERPRKTTTKTKPDIKFDIPFQQDQDQPLAHTDPLDDLKKKAGLGGDKPEVNLRKASQADTLNKTAGLGTPDMSDMLSRMRNIELDKDLEPYDEQPPETLPSVEVNTQNLPAVAGQALQAAGVQNPEFHQVSNLPGNMADMIRQLGKSLFGSLTMTPTKRIHVVANLGGKGPNSTQEVNAVAGFLKQHGDDRGPGDIDFEQVMPGYKAQTHMYTAAGIRWMLVKDFAGQYIYCWPEEDSHDASPGLEHDQPEMKRLK
jgi:hypothetical protein